MKNYLILFALAIAVSFISYGIYSFFGFTDYATLKKLGFFLVILGQSFTPLFILYLIYDRSIVAESKYLEKIKQQQEAQNPSK
jgi:hypothetical protein